MYVYIYIYIYIYIYMYISLCAGLPGLVLAEHLRVPLLLLELLVQGLLVNIYIYIYIEI